MFLSRSSIELRNTLHKQSLNLESEEEIRQAEMAWKSSGNPGALQRYLRALRRAEKHDAAHATLSSILAPHITGHANENQASNEHYERGDHASGGEARGRANEHRKTLHDLEDLYGINLNDYVKRGPEESNEDFGHRLVSLQRGMGTYRPGGTTNYLNFEREPFGRPVEGEDPDTHRRRAESFARAWEREIPGGTTEVGNRSSYGPPDEYGNQEEYIKGSYVRFSH